MIGSRYHVVKKNSFFLVLASMHAVVPILYITTTRAVHRYTIAFDDMLFRIG